MDSQVYTIEEQGMLKMLEHLFALLKSNRKITFDEIWRKTGIEKKYFNKLTNAGVIERNGTCRFPEYFWVTMPPNIYMAKKTLRDEPVDYFDTEDDERKDLEKIANQCQKDYENKLVIKKDINIPFDDFWNLYDKKVGDKEKTKKIWMKLSNKNRETVMQRLPLFLSSITDKQYQPYPATYLHQRRWMDEIQVKSIVIKNSAAINTSFPLSNYSVQQLWDEIVRRGVVIEDNRLVQKKYYT